MKNACAERRAEPFMPVQADKIAVQIGQSEVELLPAMCRIDDDIDTTHTRHRRDLPDRDHQAGTVAHMGEQDQLQRGSSAMTCA